MYVCISGHDFGRLPQDKRSKEENSLLEYQLAGMQLRYISDISLVLVLPDIPEGRSGIRPYIDRGWCLRKQGHFQRAELCSLLYV